MILRHTVLFIATSLVLLHSIIPHSHHSELTEEENLKQHETASSIIDYLSLAFHLDHEDGQLEDFIPGNDVDPVQLEPYILSNFSVGVTLEVTERELLLTSYDHFYHDRSSLTSSGLRAPPYLS